jgi:hypothetical protein
MSGTAARRALVVALVVVVGVVAVGVAAWTAEPLVAGSAGAAQGPTDVPPPTGSAGSGVAIDFQAGGRVAYGTEVRNGAWLPVAIDGLTADQDGGGLLTDLRLALLRDPSMFDFADAALRPFEPVTLWPGERLTLAVVGRFVDCRTAIDHFSPNTFVGITEVWLDVQVAGLPRVAHVPLVLSVELAAPATRTCPG